MTAIAHLAYAPDHAPVSGMHTWPVRVEPDMRSSAVQGALPDGAYAQEDCAPVELPPTPPKRLAVEDRARALCASIVGKHLGDLFDLVERYEETVYWRAVLEAAAQEMTTRGDAELLELTESGLSAAKIAQRLGVAGCPLSKSGVEASLKRARTARDEAARAEAEMEP